MNKELLVSPSDQTKEQSKVINAEHSSGEGTMSLEEMDKAIAETDPEFAQSLKEISPIQENVFEDEGIDLVPTFKEMKDKWSGKRFKFVLLLIYPGIYFLYKIKKLGIYLKLFVVELVTQEIPQQIKKIVLYKKYVGEQYHQRYLIFRRFNRIQQNVFYIAFVVTMALPFLIYRIYSKGIIPKESELFMLSIEEMASKAYAYDLHQMESFYDSPRVPQNVLNLKKIIVNIRSSESSGDNPMLAAEFYIEGISPDVLIEIKDREYEVNDRFQRVIEEMTFDELENKEGKRKLLNLLLQEVNSIVTTGRAKKVLIKNFVLKP